MVTPPFAPSEYYGSAWRSVSRLCQHDCNQIGRAVRPIRVKRVRAAVAATCAALAALVAGCSSDTAVHRIVTGRLVRVGGPAPGSPVPLSGTIEARNRAGDVVAARVGRNGRFRLELAPGTYSLTGRSPLMEDGKMVCAAAKPVDVTRAGPTPRVPVICEIS